MAYNPEDVGSKPTTGILVLVLAKLIAWYRHPLTDMAQRQRAGLITPRS
jgi:hypothetical protein